MEGQKRSSTHSHRSGTQKELPASNPTHVHHVYGNEKYKFRSNVVDYIWCFSKNKHHKPLIISLTSFALLSFGVRSSITCLSVLVHIHSCVCMYLGIVNSVGFSSWSCNGMEGTGGGGQKKGAERVERQPLRW